ncbi:Aromatic compound dioxygenase [Rhizoctonia solani]|uniref:Aromatic compound dioxygenase n=1 Tax=Rhizoctonia solani TaxID=456999 RepID=A0A8H7LEC6_9AGAM|nr:Aromatic compound dioxygenase [Rhizoctonia solani]
MHTLNLPYLALSILALSSLTHGTPSMLSLTESLMERLSAHADDDEIAHPHDLARRQMEANRRHVATAKCAREIAEYNSARRMKRSLSIGGTKGAPTEIPGYSYEVPEKNQPTYKTIQNNTCIVAPEVAEGPYFVQNELLRNDIRESQVGVDLHLDIGVIDINTCKPLPQALVEIWSANATGFYSAFTTAPPAIGPALPASTDPLYTNSATRSAIIAGSSFKMAGNKTDEMTWLRGAYPTNDNGLVEFKTIYPGYYTGRAIHIHTIVTTNWTYLTNGTVVSKSGNTRHIGQIFFDEELNDKVLATPAYQNSTQIRLENYRDAILAAQNSHGHNAFVDPKLLGDSVEDGVLAYITIGVDTNFATSIYTNNTWEPTKPSPGHHAQGPKATSVNERGPIKM